MSGMTFSHLKITEFGVHLATDGMSGFGSFSSLMVYKWRHTFNQSHRRFDEIIQ